MIIMIITIIIMIIINRQSSMLIFNTLINMRVTFGGRKKKKKKKHQHVLPNSPKIKTKENVLVNSKARKHFNILKHHENTPLRGYDSTRYFIL